MTYNSFESKDDVAFLKRMEEEKPKKSYMSKLGLGVLGLGALLELGFSYTRPNMQAQIISTELSNAQNSKMIVLNQKTNEIDTVYIRTFNSGPRLVLGNPDNYQGKVKELEEKLKSGLTIDMTLYNRKNELYKINSITDNRNLEYLTQN